MRLPRDWSGDDLVKRLKRVGFVPTRQTGSHVRLTRTSVDGEHHITVPMHKELRVGTLSSIVSDVAEKLKVSKEELLEKLK